jgi:hypothetical protein
MQSFSPHFWQKCLVSHYANLLKTCIPLLLWICCIPARAQFYSSFLPTTISLTRSCHQNAKFHSNFLPKTLNTIRKRAVTETMLSFIPVFSNSTQLMLRAFGKNEKWPNILNIWANSKRFSKMLDILFWYLLMIEKYQKG